MATNNAPEIKGGSAKSVPLPNAKERLFLSLDEAAREINCTRRFLEGKIRDSEIKVFRPSRRLVRVARAELDRWIEEFSSKGAA